MSQPVDVNKVDETVVKIEKDETTVNIVKTENQQSDISDSVADKTTEGNDNKIDTKDLLTLDKESTSENQEATEATANDRTEESGDKPEEDDPYAYLQRGDFTSEKFKIEIRGLPKYYGIGELRSLLNNRLNLATAKIKSPRAQNPWAYVCFRNEDDKLRAINILNGYRWKGKKLTAKEAKPMPDPLVKKRKEQESLSPEAKKRKYEESVEERLKKSTIPFWHIPYEDQLVIKQDEVKRILTKLANELSFSNPELMKWVNERKKKYGGMPCELWNIRYPKKLDGYRNKCEFTVGKSEVDGSPSVGFRFGGYASGVTTVGPFENLTHIPEPMKKAAKLFEQYVRGSHLPIFDPEFNSGFFRQLTARYSQTNHQLMLIVAIHPQQLNQYEIFAFKQDVIRFFTQGDGKEANVTSLYYQELVRRLPGELPPPAEHLHGDLYIYENILGLKFKISPEAFFQVNTEAAEILYQSAIEMANPSPDSTVVDICCGTGSIGLCFANKCKQVLGLEIVAQAVVNAKENAIENNITNCEFFNGAAEEIITSVMHKATNEDIIAIVDPPRAGLHNRALEMLRRTRKLNKLVYIACNPSSACKNFVSLGRPPSKTMQGEPFVPVRAVAVDMFPYTKHLELMIYFERWNGEDGNDDTDNVSTNNISTDKTDTDSTTVNNSTEDTTVNSTAESTTVNSTSESTTVNSTSESTTVNSTSESTTVNSTSEKTTANDTTESTEPALQSFI